MDKESLYRCNHLARLDARTGNQGRTQRQDGQSRALVSALCQIAEARRGRHLAEASRLNPDCLRPPCRR